MTIENNQPKTVKVGATKFPEITLDDVAKVLSLTIKDDDANKKIVFLAMLSAYTKKCQITVSLNAPSAVGKTYLATEVAKLFPDDDKIERSYASPKSFLHDDGELDKLKKIKYINVDRKIMIFTELPDPSLQAILRPLLAKDKPAPYAITNKNKLKTEKIIFLGYPAAIFCSANLRMDEQETTRSILVSPESTEVKIKHAIEHLIRRAANADQFNKWLEAQPGRTSLKERILAIKQEHVEDILINDTDANLIHERFFAMLKKPKPSHQRASRHLLELIRVMALLNVWHRKQPDGSVVVNEKDIDEAFKLWSYFFESQNLGIAPAVLNIYKKYIVPAYINKYRLASHDDQNAMIDNKIGLTSQELSAYYMHEEEATLNNDQLRKQILPQLQASGLIDIEKPKIEDNSVDKRSRHIFPKLLTDEDKKYIGIGGVGDGRTEDLDDVYDQLIAML